MRPCYSCGQPSPPGASVCPHCQVLLEVAGYRIEGVLGQGGYGAVYTALAWPTAAARGAVTAGQAVALKQHFDPAGVTQQRREFAVLNGLGHANLPHYYETFEAGDHGYLVMELVPGQNLEAVLGRHPGGLGESQVLSYALQLCDVLSYLHAQQPPILHRDIKPANIRLTPEGLIKLVDFGLLKQGLGQTGSALRGLGTPEYAPLEQYGRGGSTDPRSDLYSLGATLYHLLTGHAPEDAVTRAVIAPDPLWPPQHYQAQLSSLVAATVLRAMAIKPEDRFADVWQLREALLSAWAPYEVPIREAPPTQALADDAYVISGDLAPETSKTVTSLAFAADGRFLACGNTAGEVWLWRVADWAPLWTQNLTGYTDSIQGVAFAPDGSTVASGSGNGMVAVWRAADGALIRTFAGYGGPVESLAMAPDGLTLAVGANDRAVRLWRVADGLLLHTLAIPMGWLARAVRAVAFAPDGQVVAAGAEDGVIRLWQAGDGALLATLREHTGPVYSIAFAPDGQILASAAADHTICLWRIAGETRLETRQKHDGTVTSLAWAPDGQTLASGSTDTLVRLWQIRGDQLVQVDVLEGHSGPVTSIAFAPDGLTLASAAWDKTVKLWQV